jgi:fibrillarin-like pre-rRNA processing protein
MPVKINLHKNFQEIFEIKLTNGSKRLATKNLTPGRRVYGERIIRSKGAEYRLWDPFRSKLAAAILNKLNCFPIKPNHTVLYLGAASGTTVSHISDIVGRTGHVYCIEFASRSIRDLINNVCTYRNNTSPIFEDARFPQKYKIFVIKKVDNIYCDIAQPEQAKILADNADLFLKKQGWIMLAIKSQSIDVTKKPTEIYKREISILKKRGFSIIERINLEPYEKAHSMVIASR